MYSSRVTSPRPLTRRIHLLTLALVGLVLFWDSSNLDSITMRWLGDSDGFSLRNHWLLQDVLHDALHTLALLAYGLMALMVLVPLGPLVRLDRLQRFEVLSGVTLGLLLVGWLKVMSRTSCPWDLQEFGGTAHYVSHWIWGVADGGPGQCFPGGHASSAYAFLALALPWLDGDARAQQTGWVMLRALMLFGLLLGLAQTLRGAHFPSHTLWTALLCWLSALLNHQWFAWLRSRKSI